MLVMELFGKKPREKRARSSSELAIPNGLIGLEFECENAGSYTGSSGLGAQLEVFFGRHQDGSLRQNGIEFVLHEPLYGQDLLDAIKLMRDVYRTYKFTSSYRTSMHVHLDMERSSYPDQILNAGLIYAIVEPFIYKFIGGQRDACNYCLPWYHHDQHFGIFLDTITSTAGHANDTVTAQLRRMKEYKYSGLNFFSLGDFGTIEFRHAPVDMPYEKIVEWINVIQSIKLYATSYKSGNPALRELLAHACNSSYLQFLEEVFGKHSRVLLRLAPRPAELYQLGLKTAASFTAAAVARKLIS
jgi:Putative amidoligase enzyme